MDVVRIPLSRGVEAVIDAADVELVAGRKWHAVPSSVAGKFYARSTDGVYLHRLITGCPGGLEVDHVNNDGLDNRRSNLRVGTHLDNMRNGKFALATHCPQGHAYTEENTYRDKRGRRCKKCAAERQAGLRSMETQEKAEQRKAYMRSYYANNRARLREAQRQYGIRRRSAA